MNSIERIVAAVKFQEPDRVPVAPLVFGHAAIISEVPLREYLADGEMLARCQLSSLRRYGYDAVFAFMDACVEAEAFGAPLVFREDKYPSVERYIVDEDADLEKMSVPDPHVAGRMPEVLKAAGMLRREVGGEVLVAGLTLGPLTVATQLMGLEKTLYLSADDPQRFARYLDFCTEVTMRFGIAQIEAGVHLPIMFEPSASLEVITPAFFKELVLPRLKKAFSAFTEAGAVANIIHIAGRTAAILPLYPEAEVHIACFDYPVAIEEAKKALPRTCLFGNIRSFAFVDEPPVEIEAEAAQLLKACDGRGGFILSSGCEVPLETKPENLEALVRTAGRKRASKAA